MKLLKYALTSLLFAGIAFGQVSAGLGESRLGGWYFASAYGLWNSKIQIGTQAAGAGSITMFYPTVTLPDGRTIVPFATTAPILVGAGATAETVTPTAVSGCLKNNTAQGVCTITATFTYQHGAGELVQSGTFGLEEAVNDAFLAGGGIVMVDSTWTGAGGVTATITGNKGYTNVTVWDGRGVPGAFSYYGASNGANMTSTTHVIY